MSATKTVVPTLPSAGGGGCPPRAHSANRTVKKPKQKVQCAQITRCGNLQNDVTLYVGVRPQKNGLWIKPKNEPKRRILATTRKRLFRGVPHSTRPPSMKVRGTGGHSVWDPETWSAFGILTVVAAGPDCPPIAVRTVRGRQLVREFVRIFFV